MHELKLYEVQKKYKDKTAVKQVSYTFKHGVYGLLGENGAGKTTLMRLICGVLQPTTGNIYYDGMEIAQMGAEYRRLLGYLPQELGYYDNFTAERFLRYIAALKAMSAECSEQKIQELLELVELQKDKKKKLRTFSGGMLRRVGIAQALLNNPEILVLDEPTAGMDAFARRQMWNLLKKLNQQKLTILLTTHYMEEAETLCDRVGFMCGGRLEETDAPGHMIETLGRYAVDETSPDGLKSHYFHGKEEAIQYLSASEQETALRSTTLEDVFLETIGQQLECR